LGQKLPRANLKKRNKVFLFITDEIITISLIFREFTIESLPGPNAYNPKLLMTGKAATLKGEHQPLPSKLAFL
jgi:hypothetical protein